MTAIKQMKERISLNHSLWYAGLAKTAWYHKPKSKDPGNKPGRTAGSSKDRSQETHDRKPDAWPLNCPGNWRVL